MSKYACNNIPKIIQICSKNNPNKMSFNVPVKITF